MADRCPIRDVLERLGDRWTMLVLLTLEEGGTLRFSSLKARVQDISQRMLAQTVRRLENDGLVSRTVYPTIPPRVDYALTPLGVSFLKPLHGLLDWARQHHEDVKMARIVYQSPASDVAPLASGATRVVRGKRVSAEAFGTK